jgi:hypothetical protein
MTFMIMIPADLDRLITFFKHLLEMVKKSYPTINVAEINTPEEEHDA